MTEVEKKVLRGFACASPELRREIASKGGQEAHRLGRAHRWTSEEAAAAGRKGAQRAAEVRWGKKRGEQEA